jgi:hypothetical protein
MQIHKLETKKQENGLWGIPLSFTKYSINMIELTDDEHILLSAIMVSNSEKLPSISFQLFSIGNKTYRLNIIHYDIVSSSTSTLIKLDDYYLDDYTLYRFENESEKTIFYRNKKLEKIKSKISGI